LVKACNKLFAETILRCVFVPEVQVGDTQCYAWVEVAPSSDIAKRK